MIALLALLLVLTATIAWAVAAYRLTMPSNRTPFIAAWSCGAVIGAAVLWLDLPGRGAAIAALALGSILLFLAAVSRQKLAAGAIEVGATMPAFVGLDQNGETFDSASVAGTPLLLKFFRGHW